MGNQTQCIWPLDQLKEAFSDSLENLSPFEACALVDYPLHNNPGDHMLFVGALLWLSRQCDPARIHVAHRLNFSPSKLKKRIGAGPVFCVGGGNLGDLWPNSQRFRERVIRCLSNQPIVLLPQSMYFRDKKNLEYARKVFNVHPNLTIMLRDHVSLDLARKHFNARALLAPDQAFLLADMIPPRPAVGNGKTYYLSRGQSNREASSQLKTIHQSASGIPIGDWECMGLKGLLSGIEVLLKPSRSPVLTAKVHESTLPDTLKQILHRVDCPGYVLRSWHMIEKCVAQLEPYEYVFTDRLHGHILCTLRQIPHTIIGNNHHKLKAHWETWVSDFPGVTFADSVDELMALPGFGWVRDGAEIGALKDHRTG